jgi:dUTP pyrophosphatase
MNSLVEIGIKLMYEDAEPPIVKTEGAWGADVSAYIKRESGLPGRTILAPRNTRLIGTGLKIEPPPQFTGVALMVFSRSGLALQNVFVANAPGLVDADYRGEIMVLLYNGGLETHYVQHGDRIAQLVLVRAEPFCFYVTQKLSRTERGEKGFGSTDL